MYCWVIATYNSDNSYLDYTDRETYTTETFQDDSLKFEHGSVCKEVFADYPSQGVSSLMNTTLVYESCGDYESPLRHQSKL